MGSSLWCRGRQLNTPHNLAGYALYNLFKTVLILTTITRVKPGQERFIEFLTRLRNGNNTVEDWQYLKDNCSYENKSADDMNEFQSNEISTFVPYFAT